LQLDQPKKISRLTRIVDQQLSDQPITRCFIFRQNTIRYLFSYASRRKENPQIAIARAYWM